MSMCQRDDDVRPLHEKSNFFIARKRVSLFLYATDPQRKP